MRSHIALTAINCEFFVIYCFSSFYQILKRIYFTNFSYKLLNFFFFCRRWIHNLFPPHSSKFFFKILFYQYLQYTFVSRWIVSTQTQLSTNIAQWSKNFVGISSLKVPPVIKIIIINSTGIYWEGLKVQHTQERSLLYTFWRTGNFFFWKLNFILSTKIK